VIEYSALCFVGTALTSFFAFVINVVNTTDRTMNALNSTTGLTSSSFVSEHFVNDNDNGNFYYNLADANYTEENIRPQCTKPTQLATPNYNVAN